MKKDFGSEREEILKAHGEVTVEERREPRDFSSKRSNGNDSLAVRFKFFRSRTMCGHISAVYVSISLMQFGIWIFILSFLFFSSVLLPSFVLKTTTREREREREKSATDPLPGL